jgi:hypothetical protein
MTVQALIHQLQQCPAEAEVKAQFDINDHDTVWTVVEVKASTTGEVVIVAS